MFFVKPAIKDNTLVSALDSRSSTKLFIVSKSCRVKLNPSHLNLLFISALGGIEEIGLASGQYTLGIHAQLQRVLYRWA